MQAQQHPIDVLRERGFIANISDEDGLRELLSGERVTFYVGFDPTAESLHIGNLVGIMAMSWLQRAGHRAIALAGGATGRIGDPSGRDSERELLDTTTIDRNLAAFRRQLSQLLDLDDPDQGILVDNYDWTAPLSFLDVLRDVGKHFSVNQMIARESVKRRLESREQGISFTEFAYQILQSHDFAHLYATEGCRLQGGGSDQWGNITAGIDLTRRMHGGEVYGITWPLVEDSGGRKFSKSSGDPIWLDAVMTSPYKYFQWWMNSHDHDIERWLKLFTYLPVDEITRIVAEHEVAPHQRIGQLAVAREATRVLHGDAAVAAAERATAVLFGKEPFADLDDATLADAFAAAPSVDLSRDELSAGLGLVDVLVATGAAKSKGEARRHIEGGAVRVNNVQRTDVATVLGPDDLVGATTTVIRVGKKNYFLVRFI